ncbi:MAG: DoxX family protein [Chloroflexi bacterium]|jgi:uncharacterized membrane protein YphA (DoxX/SURF4 family)|nr:DoxX family protein [Chloroflexota bacterium]
MLGYGEGLALLRMGFGLYFLSNAISKITAGWLATGDPMMRAFIGPALQNNTAEGFYRPFLEGTVAPAAGTFAQLVVWGELLVAVSLILGLFTRLGALGTMFLVLNYMLMKGLLNNAGSSDRLFFLAGLVFLLTSAGLVWGLDGYLRHIWASNPFTRWSAGLTGRRPEQVPST